MAKLRSRDKNDLKEDYYNALLTEAPFARGDCCNHGNEMSSQVSKKETNGDEDEIFDTKLIQEGQEFCQEHKQEIGLAHLLGLMWAFTFKPVRSVLLKSGYSISKQESLTRYLSTVLHIERWYEGDFTAAISEEFPNIQIVRKSHGVAAKKYQITELPPTPQLSVDNERLLTAIRADLAKWDREVNGVNGVNGHSCLGNHTQSEPQLKDNTECPCSSLASILSEIPAVPMSQFDMVVVQFAFVGFIVLMPEAVGIDRNSKNGGVKGMDGFVYMWSIFGRKLGIQDRFNVALYYMESAGSGDLGTKDVTTFRKIFENIFVESMKGIDGTTIVMWESFLEGASKYLVVLRFKTMIEFILKYGVGCKDTSAVHSCLSWRDKLALAVLKFTSQCFRNIAFLRNLKNWHVTRSLVAAQIKYLPNWRKYGQRLSS